MYVEYILYTYINLVFVEYLYVYAYQFQPSDRISSRVYNIALIEIAYFKT